MWRGVWHTGARVSGDPEHGDWGISGRLISMGWFGLCVIFWD